MTARNSKVLITVISDLHVGSSVAILPANGLEMDDGGVYKGSKLQDELGRVWEIFFEDIRKMKRICKRVLVINGDSVEGAHHNTVSLATNNIQVQEKAAVQLLLPKVKLFDEVFVTRGTEAHVQSGAQSEERVARAINAKPDENGNFARWQLWMDVKGLVFNVAHHIGTTSSAAYESSAPMREMVAALVEAGQWDQKMPDVLVQSHRHRFITLGIPSAKDRIQTEVTPSWQLRTPFVERIDRMRMPHIGGVNFIVDEGQCSVQEHLFPLKANGMEHIDG